MANMIYDKTHYAVISDGIIETKKLEFGYRIEPSESDSGWRLFSDRKETPKKYYKVSFAKLRRWFGDVFKFYEEKPFTVIEKLEGEWVARSRKDKTLDAVPEALRAAGNQYDDAEKYKGEDPCKRGPLDALYDPKDTAIGLFVSTTKLVLIPYEDDEQ